MALSEFALIQRYFSNLGAPDQAVVGVGDDCAVLQPPPQQQLCVSVDTLVAGVHFNPGTDPYFLGRRALAVNLSDLAACGARPWWFTLALTLPDSNDAWLSAFSRGLADIARQFGIGLVGGDTTRGPLALTLQVAGLVPTGQALLRSGARVGDAIYVSGYLGDAAAGLALDGTDNCQSNPLWQQFANPLPQVNLGIGLRGVASAAIDVSDGLLADLGHILQQSKVGAEVYLAQLPLSDALRRGYDGAAALQLALTGGDDYQLCITAAAATIAARPDLAGQLTCIGQVTAGPGLRCVDAAGQLVVTSGSGYQHFSEA